MSHKLPSLDKVSRKRTIVEKIQRLFGFVKFLSSGKKIIDKAIFQKRAMSNAGYSLTLKQVLKIINSCSEKRDSVLIETLAFTGMRRAEATALQIDDILWDKNLILIQHGKGDKQRLVPIPRKLIENLRILVGSRKIGAIFKSRCGDSLSNRQVNRIVAKAGKDAKVENPNPNYRNITCHLFRHTFARLWKEQQGSMESLSTIFGHSSQATTMDLYGKESMEDVRNNYDQVIKKMYKEKLKD